MAFHHLNIYHVLGMYLSFVASLSLAQDLKLPLKAVNLGNWLVVERWMEPSLFDEIPNNKLLDGTKLQFKSTKLQKYLAAENGGDSNVAVNHISASDWETFRLWRINENSFNFRVSHKQFVGLSRQGNGRIVAKRYVPGDTETFQIVRVNGDHRVRIKASNMAKSETEFTADYPPGGSGGEDSDPSVFIMTIVETLQGEYRPAHKWLWSRKSFKVLQKHWNTYITREDFEFMSSNGLNAMRIPVGWWIKYDQTESGPQKPFVRGSLQALDKALTFAEQVLEIIICILIAQINIHMLAAL